MKQFIIFFAFAFIVLSGVSQEEKFRVVFYNVENYFDPVNDSLTQDDEFTPEGTRHWSWYKYNKKTANIYKALVAFNGWVKPDIIALCEIENRYVLKNLLKNTPLGDAKYEIVHKESEDFRGIDVGLFYNPETVWPLSESYLKIRFPDRPDRRTRDILYLKALLKNKDTLHIFVNHWPSKYGGAVATIPSRAEAARTLKRTTDSIRAVNPRANIVITGDLNDTPEDESVLVHLSAKPIGKVADGDLVNLTGSVSASKWPGSHKYQGQWSAIDQFIVSPAMFSDSSKVATSTDMMRLGDIDMLLEDDEKFTGKKPYRTFIGFKYHGGFSDHLPISLDLILR